MVALAIFEVIRLNVIASNVRNKYQLAVISEATTNAENMYQPVRDGYASSWQGSHDAWSESNFVDDATIRDRLNSELSAGEHGQVKILSVSSNIKVGDLIPLDGDENAQTYYINGKVDVEIPFSFGWKDLPPIKLTIDVKTQWRAKF
jgi:hypothetical protein